MVAVHTVKDFVRYNDKDIRRFMTYKTGIFDKDLINDTVQDFYVSLIKTRALEAYDSSKGSFDVWVNSLFCWLLPKAKSKNFRTCFDVISKVSNSQGTQDVWEFVGSHSKDYRVEGSYMVYSVVQDSEEEVQKGIFDFVRYIKSTEKPIRSGRMVSILLHRYAGMKSVDIAQILKISPNMVKVIRQYTFTRWKVWKAGEEK